MLEKAHTHQKSPTPWDTQQYQTLSALSKQGSKITDEQHPWHGLGSFWWGLILSPSLTPYCKAASGLRPSSKEESWCQWQPRHHGGLRGTLEKLSVLPQVPSLSGVLTIPSHLWIKGTYSPPYPTLHKDQTILGRLHKEPPSPTRGGGIPDLSQCHPFSSV